jgi:hypothetical protein
LLNRLDGKPVQDILPSCTGLNREVAIDSLNGRLAQKGNFGQQCFNDGRLGIISINEYSKPLRWLFGVSFRRVLRVDCQDTSLLPTPSSATVAGNTRPAARAVEQ